MIKAYMQVDFNNDLAMRYNEIALKSFERVSDIFKIEVIQCITPDNLLEELQHTPYWHTNKRITPGELGSYHSNYRMMKKLATAKRRFWVMEHDAYLIPEHEDMFRKFTSKYKEMEVMLLGTATEIWTASPGVAKEHCKIVEAGTRKGTMSVMHEAVDRHCRNIDLKFNRVYWPLNRYNDPRWVNKTGIGTSATQAHRRPLGIEHAPCTQLIDSKYGSSIKGRDALATKIGDVVKKNHNDLHFVDLDKN